MDCGCVFLAISRTWSMSWCLPKDPSLDIAVLFSVCNVCYSERLRETCVFPGCNPCSEILSETCKCTKIQISSTIPLLHHKNSQSEQLTLLYAASNWRIRKKLSDCPSRTQARLQKNSLFLALHCVQRISNRNIANFNNFRIDFKKMLTDFKHTWQKSHPFIGFCTSSFFSSSWINDVNVTSIQQTDSCLLASLLFSYR